MHYVKIFVLKNAYWGHTAKEFGSEMRFRDSWKFLSSSTSRLALLDPRPDSSSSAAQSIFQIQKSQKGSL